MSSRAPVTTQACAAASRLTARGVLGRSAINDIKNSPCVLASCTTTRLSDEAPS